MSNLLDRMREARKAQSSHYSETDSMEILFVEAQLAEAGRIEDYHVPGSEGLIGKTQARCKESEIDPAWAVIDGMA